MKKIDLESSQGITRTRRSALGSDRNKTKEAVVWPETI